jgi:hypothetical protein
MNINNEYTKEANFLAQQIFGQKSLIRQMVRVDQYHHTV